MKRKRKVTVQVQFLPEQLAVLRTGKGRLEGAQCWCIKVLGVGDRKRRLTRVSVMLAVVEQPEDALVIGAIPLVGLTPDEEELRTNAERLGREAVPVLRKMARERGGWMKPEQVLQQVALRCAPAAGGVH